MNSKILAICFAISALGYAQEEEQESIARQVTEEKQCERESTAIDLQGTPSSFAGHDVNVITGDYCEVHCDLEIPGTSCLALQRAYTSNWGGNTNLHQGWALSYGDELDVYQNVSNDRFSIYLREALGGQIRLKKGSRKRRIGRVVPESYERGLTNCNSGEISGRTNRKNITCVNEKQKKKIWQIFDGSGAMRRFSNVKENLFCIQNALLPSGSSLHFRYTKGPCNDNSLHIVQELSQGGLELGKFIFDYPESKEFKKNPFLMVYGTHCQNVRYGFSKKEDKFLLTSVAPSHAMSTHYQYDDQDKPCLTRRSSGSKFLEIAYYDKGKHQVQGRDVVISGENDARWRRVKEQRAPVGCDSTPVVTHRFLYFPKNEKAKKISEGYAEVYNAAGHKTTYVWNEAQRLTAIEAYDGAQMKRREKIFWGEDKDESNLVSRAIEDASGAIPLCRALYYDDRGNSVAEELWGDLTGDNSIPIVLDSSGRPVNNGCEHYWLVRSYSQDGRNLLLTERDEIKETAYSYCQGHDHPLSRFVKVAGKIAARTFYAYDSHGTLIEEINDDGSSEAKDDFAGVSERYICRIEPVAHPAGLPGKIEKYGVDIATRQEILIERVFNSFNSFGWKERQAVYGSDGHHAYTLEWQYDAHGNVIAETNALGQVTLRLFDDNDNKIYEKGPKGDSHVEYTYDCAGRLIGETLVGIDGLRLTKNYCHNTLSQLTKETDYYGNETTYTYDALGRCIKTVHPPYMTVSGAGESHSEKVSYDVLGNVNRHSDQYGSQTLFRSNIRGQRLDTYYPDGTSEHIRYGMDGALKMKKQRDGTSVHYRCDHQKRPVYEEFRGSNGAVIGCHMLRYNEFHLLEETNIQGCTTHYRYDPCGRLIEKQTPSSSVCYKYDPLGLLAEESSSYAPGESIISYKSYDLLGRLLKEYTTNSQGKEQQRFEYRYDAGGNCTEKICFYDTGPSFTVMEYSPSGMLASTVDALGNKTVMHHHYGYLNSLGQRVPYIEEVSPLGICTQTEYSARHQVVRKTLVDPFGNKIQEQLIRYDAKGNALYHLDFLPEEDRYRHTRFEYDAMGRQIREHRNADTLSVSTIETVFNYAGQKQAVIYPDSESIHFQYNGAGRLEREFSPSGKRHLEYHYDAGGNLVLCHDLVENHVTRRLFNIEGQMTEETLGNGLTMKYGYDGIGRLSSVVFPDNSSAAYQYNGLLLAKVIRHTPQGDERYAHHYLEFDRAGNVLQASMIGKGGLFTKRYDPLGRVKEILSEHFQQTAGDYDAKGNLLVRYTRRSCDAEAMVDYYTYNNRQEIIEEKGCANHTYTYDALHNRRSMDGRCYVYNTSLELIGDCTRAFAWDPRGNVTSDATLEGQRRFFCYDAMNRLVSVEEQGELTTYTYDFLGRRLTKTRYIQGHAALCQRFFYQKEDEIGSCDTLGNIQELRILGCGRGAEQGAAIAIELGQAAYAPVHDISGHVAMLIDIDTGKSSAYYRYSAFGLAASSGEIADANPWRYSSKRYDPETSWYYFGSRYYDSLVGRWTTPDPLSYSAGVNLYAFVGNHPLTSYDPYGLQEVPRACPLELHHFYQQRTTAPNRFNLAVRNCGIIGARECMGWMGKGVETFATHLLPPISAIRDPMLRSGLHMQGRCREFVSTNEQRRSQNFVVGDYDIPGERYIMINGINTPVEEAHTNAAKFSEMLGGQNVYYTHNATGGFVCAAIDLVRQYAGLCTDSIHKAYANMRDRLTEVGPEGRVYVTAHSQGGRIVDCVRKFFCPNQLKNQVSVQTYGSAAMLSNNHFFEAQNYASILDPISAGADPIGFACGLFGWRGIKLTILPNQGSFGFDHFWNGKTYQKQLKNSIDQIKKNR